MLLPPGFRFHPTDEELVGYYLKRKVDGLKIELEVMPLLDLCKFDPWELPDKSLLPKIDMEWFFFCPWDRKYPNGSRTNRATASGYWKATGKDRRIACASSVFGLRKTLVFYLGRAPGGERTDWIMHEYRLCQDLFHGSTNFLGDFALCRVVKRNGNWPSHPHGESKAKICPPSMFEFNRKRKFDEVFYGTEESSCPDIFERCSSSPALNSPEVGRRTELQPNVIDHAEKGFRGPHGISDASEASLLEGGVSMSLDPCDHFLIPSDVTYTEEAFLIDDHGNKCCLSSIQSPAHCSWEDITFQSLQWDATKHIDASYSGDETFNATVPPAICRQASEGEEANLWLQEDNRVTVM